MNNNKYTLDDLKHVNLLARKPEPDLTDQEWQKQFEIMRWVIPQSTNKKMSLYEAPIFINGQIAYQTDKAESQMKRYKRFINDVLDSIRSGEYDYCYYIYQITELLKFENTRLRSRYLKDDQCFEVWLDLSNTESVRKGKYNYSI